MMEFVLNKITQDFELFSSSFPSVLCRLWSDPRFTMRCWIHR
jgi:hypothetical protein